MKLLYCLALFLESYFLYTFFPIKETPPVQWTFTANKIVNRIYDIHVTAHIDNGWYINSQNQPKDAGCIPLLIIVVQNKYVTHVGGFKEIGTKITYTDSVLNTKSYIFKHEVNFTKKVVLNADVKTELEGIVLCQICNKEMCYNPTPIKFKIKLD